MEAVRRIHKFNFQSETMESGAKTHVALVDKAANLTEALVMKSTYITQTTEVETYGDDGKYSFDGHQVRITDYDGDTVYIRDKTVSVVESTVDKINVIN